MTADPYAIETVAQLRDVLDAPHPVVQTKVFDHVDAHARAFIERAPLLFLATHDKDGRVDVSPKGDAPGFVVVQDDRTLLLPDRKGNNLAYGFLNLLETGRIGLIFTVPGVRETLRVNGRATLTRDPALLEGLAAQGKPAVLCTRVHVEECFFHCGKALIRAKVWQTDTWPADYTVQLGRQLANKNGAGDEVARGIEERLQADYRDNLY